MGAERCSIMLMDQNARELILDTTDPHTGELKEFHIPWIAASLAGLRLWRRQIVNDVEQDPAGSTVWRATSIS